MITGMSLSFILAFIVAAFFIVDFSFMAHYDKDRDAGKGWSWDYTLFVLGLGLLILVQPVFFPFLGVSVEYAWGLFIQIVGIFLVIISFWVHVWARLHLRKFYTERVELQADHRVVDSGPYARVRHPLVTSFFMLAIGIFLLAPALTTLAMLIYVFWDFLRATSQEEELLGKNLPGYQDYMRRVPKFLPRLRK